MQPPLGCRPTVPLVAASRLVPAAEALAGDALNGHSAPNTLPAESSAADGEKRASSNGNAEVFRRRSTRRQRRGCHSLDLVSWRDLAISLPAGWRLEVAADAVTLSWRPDLQKG